MQVQFDVAFSLQIINVGMKTGSTSLVEELYTIFKTLHFTM